jgi:MFS family permease
VTADAAARRPAGWSPAAASVLGALALVLVAASVPLAGQARQLNAPAETAAVIYVLACAAVGVVVARHQPGNPLGWLLLLFAVVLMLSLDAGYYAVFAYNLGHRGLPFGAVAVLLVPLWALAAALFSLVILLFPDGRVPSQRWRWVLWAYAGLVACYLAFSYSQTIAAVAGHRIRLDSNGDVLGTQHFPGWFGLLVLIPISVLWLSFGVHQVLSWRRAAGERRQQLKWLASGVVVALGVGAVASSLVPGPAGQALSVAIAALPASIGVGISKYRLYEIDRIISRTLAYAIVTGLLVGVYAGLVLLATAVLGVTSPVAVAVATLAAAALFTPLRRRVQRRVDRRFNRARYDADQTVAAFAGRLKDAVDLDMIGADLAGVVQQALEPTHVTISVRQVQ